LTEAETKAETVAESGKGKDPSGKELRQRVVEEKAVVEKKTTVKHCPKSALILEYASTSEAGRGVWYARIPHDHTLDDVLQSSYFGQFQSDEGGLRSGDIIIVEPQSALWCVNLRVMAKVPKLSLVKTREVVNTRQYYGVKAPNGVRFEWRGEAAKWVIVKGDVDVDAGFDSQDEALARYEELLKDKAA